MLISVDSRTYLLARIKKFRIREKYFKKFEFINNDILSEKSGPQKFLSDLLFTIDKNNLAKITFNFLNSNIHLINSGFYSPLWKNFKPKNKKQVILRLDGIGIDSIDNKSDRDKKKYSLLDLIDKSSFLIYQSKFCKNCFLDIFESLPEGKIIRNGAKELTCIPLNGIKLLSKINKRFKGKFFSLAGRFSSRKRIKDVINRFNESDIGNLVVLSDIPYELKYQNPRIIYLGMIDPDSARYIISKSFALIHFDRYDWCPNLVVGAINDHTPVICSNFGGTPEITGNNGLIIKEFPEDLPQNLEGINYVKNAKFPSEEFKEIISDLNSNGLNTSFDDSYGIDNTAKAYVKAAKNLYNKNKNLL